MLSGGTQGVADLAEEHQVVVVLAGRVAERAPERIGLRYAVDCPRGIEQGRERCKI